MTGRQVQIRWGSGLYQETLDLNSTTYALVADGWGSNGSVLEIRTRIEFSSLAERERLVAPIQRLLTLAATYTTELIGSPVWVYTKTCDDLTQIAEIGATWLRKRILSGAVLVADSGLSTAQYAVLTLSLEVGELWQRAAPLPFATCADASAGTTGYGILGAGATLTAPRVSWTVTTGLTARYFWRYGINIANPASTVYFIKIGATLCAWWDEATKRFKMQDAAGHTCQSSGQAFALAQEIEVTFVFNPGNSMAIYIDGVADGTTAACTFATAETYTLCEATSTVALLYGIQIWPAALTATQAAGLPAWGRPEPEWPFLDPPTTEANTTAAYTLYNVPGDSPAPLRLVLGSPDSQDYRQVRAAVQIGRTIYASGSECEHGTLGAATTEEADATASGSAVARVTPADTAWATRTTTNICTTAGEVYLYAGHWRVLLAGTDNAAAVGVNQIRLRLVTAGQAATTTEPVSFGATATRSLLDCGTLTIPDGAWPEGATRAAATIYSGSFLTLELQTRNTTGAGGGTLDLDKIYLQPLDREGIAATPTWDASTQVAVLDFISDPPAGILTPDWRTLEYAGWADWPAEPLHALAAFGPNSGQLLFLFAYRDAAEGAQPNDEVSLLLFCAPQYRR